MTSTTNRAWVQRATEAEDLGMSPTNGFRFMNDGAGGTPDFYEDRGVRGDGPPLHRHPWASWEYVVDGQIRVVIEEDEFILTAGDAVYIPANAVHTYVIESDTARAVGVSLSQGRFADLQRNAAPQFREPGGPNMELVMGIATRNGVELLGPPLQPGSA